MILNVSRFFQCQWVFTITFSKIIYFQFLANLCKLYANELQWWNDFPTAAIWNSKEEGGWDGGWCFQPLITAAKMVILTIFRTFGLPWKPVAKTHGPLTVASCRMDLSGPIYAVWKCSRGVTVFSAWGKEAPWGQKWHFWRFLTLEGEQNSKKNWKIFHVIRHVHRPWVL